MDETSSSGVEPLDGGQNEGVQDSGQSEQPQQIQYIYFEHFKQDGQADGYTRLDYSQGKQILEDAMAEYQASIQNATETEDSESIQAAEGDDAYTQADVITACCVVLVFAIFAVVGAVASRTLLRSMERK